MADKIPITSARLRELFSYDPATGIFTWRVSRRGIICGMIAGADDGLGYVRVGIDGRDYRAHRLAWLYIHGRWPLNQIDHINGNRSDNRISNLRPSNQAQNVYNSRRRSDNKSGLKGVKWSVGAQKWEARIQKDGQFIYLGLFQNARDAHMAYSAAAYRLFGQFARNN